MRLQFKPPLRLVFAAALGALGLAVTLVLALIATDEAARRVETQIGRDLGELAFHMADKLDSSLHERWRDIGLAAQDEVLSDPQASAEAKRRVLKRLNDADPDYAILGFMTPEGRVLATSKGLIEGADVSKRDFFQEGLKGPFLGDVHDAQLLAKLLGGDPDNPPRFVDLAAPVRAGDGRLVGVVGAHLYWNWAHALRASLLAATAHRRGVDVMVLARDGTVLLGPRELEGRPLPEGLIAAARQGDVQGRAWPDGRAMLAASSPTKGYRGTPGLGWLVVARHDAAEARAPIRDLRARILASGALLAALGAALAWAAAGWIVSPLARLARAAAALGQGQTVPIVASHASETDAVAQALGQAGAELRRQGRERASADAARVESEARLALALEAAHLGAWELELATGRVTASASFADLFGLEAGGPLAVEAVRALVHPDDRALQRAAVEQAIAHRDRLEVEFRIQRPDGVVRWMALQGRVVLDEYRRPLRLVGVAQDVTERRAASERQRLLINELNHRVKNTLATVQSIALLTSRTHPEAAAYREAFTARLLSLAKTHDLLTGSLWESAALRDILAAELDCYADGHPDRVTLRGPPVRVPPRVALALGMAVHELATNAAKYGAFARAEGRVAVKWTIEAGAESRLVLSWAEDGGPPVALPRYKGFGTRMLERSLARELDGVIALEFHAQGVRCLMNIPLPSARTLSASDEEPAPAALTA